MSTTTLLSQMSQYASLGNELAEMLAQAGVVSAHTQAAVAGVSSVVSGVASVGQVASQVSQLHGIEGVGAFLLALQMFAPHLLPSNIKIVAVSPSVTAPTSVLPGSPTL